VGDAEKLNTFLDLNPEITRDMIFVDGANGLTSFPAYDAVGLGLLDKDLFKKEETKKAAKKVGVPKLGGLGGWWKYLRNVMKVTPIGDNRSTEGVKRLGGTFVLDGSAVTYAYADPLPGVDAPVDEVIGAALA
jgi:hypothetical protein